MFAVVGILGVYGDLVIQDATVHVVRGRPSGLQVRLQRTSMATSRLPTRPACFWSSNHFDLIFFLPRAARSGTLAISRLTSMLQTIAWRQVRTLHPGPNTRRARSEMLSWGSDRRKRWRMDAMGEVFTAQAIKCLTSVPSGPKAPQPYWRHSLKFQKQ